MTILHEETDLEHVFGEEIVLPCDGPCTDGPQEWWLKIRKHEPCDDGEPVIMLMCTPCKTLAHHPETVVNCGHCGNHRYVLDYIIAIGEL